MQNQIAGYKNFVLIIFRRSGDVSVVIMSLRTVTMPLQVKI